MNKIFIIAKREFLTRVRKKTFLLTTIGLPLLIFGIYALLIHFAVNSTESTTIAVQDEANVFNGKLKGSKDMSYVFVNHQTKSDLDSAVAKEKYDGYILVPAAFKATDSISLIQVVSKKSIGLMAQSNIRDELQSILEDNNFIQKLHITKQQLDSLRKTDKVSFVNMSSGKDSSSKTAASTAIGYGFGFLIYIVLLIYGTMVMRGVAEEKTNRIAEVIISSVKPFQLMMGKIVGIGSVGLLQFFIWITLTIILQFLLPLIFPGMLHSVQGASVAQAAQVAEQSGMLSKINEALSQVNIPLIIGCFLFYFFGGYFMYASLFAAIGSLVSDDPNEAQSLTLPVTMPIIFGIVILMQAIQVPNSPIAVFGSLFPLTSPIVMMARVAHGVPEGVSALQLVLSMILLVLGFIGTTWLAGKIYRTGILMYGKKVNFKELAKWIVRKS